MVHSEPRTTIVIKTIGRETLQHAIDSAEREALDHIVVSDGTPIGNREIGQRGRVIELGRRWGYYGGMAANVGAALAGTDYITFLDDDDELVEGTGDRIRERLAKDGGRTDIYVGGQRYAETIRYRVGGQTIETKEMCMRPDLGPVVGNVAAPTMKRDILRVLPFADDVPSEKAHLTDYIYIRRAMAKGYSLDWFGFPVFLMRPRLAGTNGRGA